MEPLGLTAYRLAKELAVPAPRGGDIVRGKRAIPSRYGVAAGDLFWASGAVLAEFAERVRSAAGGGESGAEAGCAQGCVRRPVVS